MDNDGQISKLKVLHKKFWLKRKTLTEQYSIFYKKIPLEGFYRKTKEQKK